VSKPPYEAKVTMREAPSIYELLANELKDALNQSLINEEDLKPLDINLTDYQMREMTRFDHKRHARNIIAQTEETLIDQYPKFQTKLIMPDHLKWFFYETGGVVCDNRRKFPKKKESENYAYLLVVKKLYHYGLFGEDFYPSIDKIVAKNITFDNFMSTDMTGIDTSN
jgi:hypothetical protein